MTQSPTLTNFKSFIGIWSLELKYYWTYYNNFLISENESPPIDGEFLDYILDITIAYPQGKPLDLPNIVTGLRDPFQTHFLYRLYHTSQVSYNCITFFFNIHYMTK